MLKYFYSILCTDIAVRDRQYYIKLCVLYYYNWYLFSVIETNLLYFFINVIKQLLPAIDIYDLPVNLQLFHDLYSFSGTNVDAHNVRVKHLFPVASFS